MSKLYQWLFVDNSQEYLDMLNEWLKGHVDLEYFKTEESKRPLCVRYRFEDVVFYFLEKQEETTKTALNVGSSTNVMRLITSEEIYNQLCERAKKLAGFTFYRPEPSIVKKDSPYIDFALSAFDKRSSDIKDNEEVATQVIQDRFKQYWHVVCIRKRPQVT